MRTIIEALGTAAGIPSKQRSESINPIIDAVCDHAYQHGLSRDHLQAVVAIVTHPCHLDQTCLTSLIRNLYPAEKVSSQIVVTVAGALGQGRRKPSAATQSALLKWIIAVIDVLENVTILSQLYSVFFNLLDSIGLRTSLCHLLCLVTRRKHIRHCRVQQLLEMARTSGQDPALMRLLRVYKDYYPELIVGTTAVPGRTSFTSTAARDEWQQRLHSIQDTGGENNTQHHYQQNGFKVIRREAKRAKLSILPDVHTTYASKKSVTLEEVSTADDLVMHLERIEMPNQILSVLHDPLLQRYLALRPSAAAAQRLDLWLDSFFREGLETVTSGSDAVDHLGELLSAILNSTKATKVLVAPAQRFLMSYIPLWDGQTYSESILGLLAFVPMQNFKQFQSSYLRPAETAIVGSGTVDAYDRLLDFYTTIVQTWNHSANNCAPGLGDDVDDPVVPADFTALTTHISSSILSVLSAELHTPLTTVTAILTYYSTLSTLSSPLTPLTIPPAPTIYTLLFHPSIATLSHLCTVLASYKRAFEADVQPNATTLKSLPRSVTNSFNGYLMDVANLLWRSRGLSATDENSMACLCRPSLSDALNAYVSSLAPVLIPPSTSPSAVNDKAAEKHNTATPAPGTGPDYSLSMLFGLSHNPLTASIALDAFRHVEDSFHHQNDGSTRSRRHPPGPVTQRSLHRLSRPGGGGEDYSALALSWKEYRLAVLDWLAERGAGGLRDFIFVTMKDLRKESLPVVDSPAPPATAAAAAATATPTAIGADTGRHITRSTANMV